MAITFCYGQNENEQLISELEETEKGVPQTKKGNILLGGSSNLNFTSLKSKVKMDSDSRDLDTTTNIEFSPLVGFFVADDFALGFGLPITYSSEKDDDDDKFTISSFTFAPFVRKYFGTNNVKPYLQGQVGFGRVKSKYESSSYENSDSLNLFLYGIDGGIGIFVNEKVSFDLALGYAYSSSKPKDSESRSKFITSGIGIALGIVFVL